MAKITIKIKGIEGARQATTGKLNLLAGKAAKGGAVGATKLGKGGLMLAQGAQREVEIEGGRFALQQGKVGAHAAIQSPIHGVTPAKGFSGAAFKVGGGVTKGGTIWTGTGTSLGLGVGLGTFGPILLVTALGLMATGIYIYIRSQSVQRRAEHGETAD